MMDAADSDLSIPNDVQCFLLADKMSCVRWVPQLMEDEHFFVTGSWGNKVNAVNLWNLVHDELTDGESGVPLVPKSTAKFCVTGDVVGLDFINDTNLVSVTSEGTLSVLDLNRESALSYDFTHKFNMHDLHTVEGRQSACSAMSVSKFDQYVITGGEDGIAKIISGEAGKVINNILHPDNSSISCLSFIYPNVVVTGRHCGMLNIYDIRGDCNVPVASTGTCHEEDHEMTVPMCVNYLPKHKSLILAGLENGSIITWDIRMPNDATYEFGEHSDPITDIKFTTRQDIQFSADAGGKVVQCSVGNMPSFMAYYVEKKQTRMQDFKPINSIDVNEQHMICGGDAEMLFMIDLW
uniref:Nucleoporin Nup43 n=1 Tax=Anopheles minimus TaxID=112268 RepID=A0A182WD27_9DIPT